MESESSMRHAAMNARCKGWHQEAAMRMLMNNLDPDVAENPDQLVVYGGTGRAAQKLGSVRRDCSLAARTRK